MSDLGVGPNAWLVDAGLIINGLLLLGFAVGFTLFIQSVLRQGWRWLIAVLLAFHGLGLAVAGIFTEAPSTLMIHYLVGATLGFVGPVVAFLVTGPRSAATLCGAGGGSLCWSPVCSPWCWSAR